MRRLWKGRKLIFLGYIWRDYISFIFQSSRILTAQFLFVQKWFEHVRSIKHWIQSVWEVSVVYAKVESEHFPRSLLFVGDPHSLKIYYLYYLTFKMNNLSFPFRATESSHASNCRLRTTILLTLLSSYTCFFC